MFGALIVGTGAGDGIAFDEDELSLLDALVQTSAFGVASLRTQRQRNDAQEMVARLAYYDQLTGLPNRINLLTALQQQIALSKAGCTPLALLHIEVWAFRGFNNILGYQAADELIIEVWRRVAAQRSENGFLARVGETEFALLLPHSDACFATQAAHGLQQSMLTPVDVRGMSLNARVCIGIALSSAALISRSGWSLRAIVVINFGWRPKAADCLTCDGDRVVS